MLRFLKQGNKLARYFNDWLRFRPGVDRFIMISAFFFIFCHLACCAWYMQASFGTQDSWLDQQDLEGKSNFQVKISLLKKKNSVCSFIFHHFIILWQQL